MSFFEMNTGKISGCAKGPTVHHADGFLWFWLGNFEYSFKISYGNILSSWAYDIKRYIKCNKNVDSVSCDRRFLI